MTETRHRVGRAATLAVAAALTLLPVSAHALSPVSSSPAGANSEEKEMAKQAKVEASAEKEPGGKKEEAPGQNKEEPPGKSSAAPGHNREEPTSPGDPTDPGTTDPGTTDPGTTDPGAITEPTTAPGATPGPATPDPEPEPQGSPLSPIGPAVGPTPASGAPPSIVPSAAVPTQGGLGTINPETLPAFIGAAVVMFDSGVAAPAVDPPDPVAPSPGPVSGGVVRVLSPALPPPLTHAVAAPFVVAEALFEAMASSGQALVLPVLAAVAALLAPRRRDVLANVLEQD